jgi:integrase
MATLARTIEAFTAAREYDRATLTRLGFWADQFGTRELADITADEVDAALLRLAERGRLQPRRNGKAETIGKPLSGATLNRHLSQLASIYKYARRLRLLPRGHVPPTHGVEKSPEPPDPNRYLRPEEVERLLKVARVLDHTWQRLPAMIVVAFHTGLRVGNILDLRWRDVDLGARTATVLKTKNGRPHVAALSDRAVQELAALPKPHAPDDRIFGNTRGGRYQFRRLWDRVCTEAGLPGRNFHQLRHGCGSVLAAAGVGQATIMAVMGHRTLTASARYMHADTSDKQRVVDRVFS